MGDGVLHLIQEQNSSVLEVRNIAKLIASFPLYDLDQLFIDERALQHYALDTGELPQDMQQLDDAAMRTLLSRYDHILGF